MNLKRKFHRDLNRYQTPASPIAETHPATPLRPRKKWLTAPVAVAMAILLTVSASAACGVIIHYLNNEVITENNTRLTEIPEGYVGIYSVADLVTLRENVKNGVANTHYILMSDITFTDADYAEGGICEGGWVPLDTVRRIGRDKPTAEYPSAGYSIIHALEIFHGNGHVIRNLRINAPSDTDTDRYVGLFGNTNAEIIHLGLEDCTITVRETVTKPFATYALYDNLLLGITVHVGGIAGHAEYIGGCYVKGLTLDLTTDFAWTAANSNLKEQYADTALYNLNVGGIAGSTTYADACYAEDITLRIRTEGEPYAKLYAGLLAGRATSCVTSWAQGTIKAEGDAYRTKDIAEIACNYPSHSFPTIVPKESYETLLERVDAYYGKDNFYSKLFRAYFVLKNTEEEGLSEENRTAVQALVDGFNDRYAFVSGQEKIAYTAFYVFDPYSSPQELERIGAVITAAFTAEEEYLDFCRAHNIRIGLIDCHTFAPDQRVTAEDLANFNLETLWYLTDGRPRLRIFAN